MAVRFRGDYEGIGRMLCAPFMVADMLRRAEKVKAYAVATAPVGREHDDARPRYKDSFRVEAGIRQGRTRRAYGRVINDAPHAIIVEYGNRNTPRHATLRRALEAAAGDD